MQSQDFFKNIFPLLLTTFSRVHGFLFFTKRDGKTPQAAGIPSINIWDAYYLKLNSPSISYNTYQGEGCRAIAKACLHMQHCNQEATWSAFQQINFHDQQWGTRSPDLSRIYAAVPRNMKVHTTHRTKWGCKAQVPLYSVCL